MAFDTDMTELVFNVNCATAAAARLADSLASTADFSPNDRHAALELRNLVREFQLALASLKQGHGYDRMQQLASALSPPVEDDAA